MSSSGKLALSPNLWINKLMHTAQQRVVIHSFNLEPVKKRTNSLFLLVLQISVSEFTFRGTHSISRIGNCNLKQG